MPEIKDLPQVPDPERESEGEIPHEGTGPENEGGVAGYIDNETEDEDEEEDPTEFIGSDSDSESDEPYEIDDDMEEEEFLELMSTNTHYTRNEDGTITFTPRRRIDSDPEDLPAEDGPEDDDWDDVDVEGVPMLDTKSEIDKNFEEFYLDTNLGRLAGFELTEEQYDDFHMRVEDVEKVEEHPLSAQRICEPDEATYLAYTKAAKAAGIIENVLPYSGQDVLRRYLQSQSTCEAMFHHLTAWDKKNRRTTLIRSAILHGPWCGYGRIQSGSPIGSAT